MGPTPTDFIMSLANHVLQGCMHFHAQWYGNWKVGDLRPIEKSFGFVWTCTLFLFTLHALGSFLSPLVVVTETYYVKDRWVEFSAGSDVAEYPQ